MKSTFIIFKTFMMIFLSSFFKLNSVFFKNFFTIFTIKNYFIQKNNLTYASECIKPQQNKDLKLKYFFNYS